jgi:putative spermidine/putrescine transport system substrate-binding protein
MDDQTQRWNGELSRRTLLKRGSVTLGMLAVPGLLAACGSSSDEGGSAATAATSAAAAREPAELTRLIDAIRSREVIIGSFGGTTEEARKAAFWDSFTERTGVKIRIVDIPGSLGDDMLLGKVPTRWDAVHSSGYMVLLADEGKKPLPTLEMTEDLLPPEVAKSSFQSFYMGYVPGYITGTWDREMAGWADFFDTRTFPGKRAWPNRYYFEGTREAALLGDGVTPEDLYPLDVERADAKIKSIWDDMVFYEAYPQIQQFLSSGTAAVAFAPNGIFSGARKQGLDVTIDWTLPLLSLNNMAVMPDAPNLDAVQALAGWCAQPERAAEFARRTNYGPPVRAAFDEMTEEEISQLPNAPGRDTVMPTDKYLSEVFDRLAADNQKLFS